MFQQSSLSSIAKDEKDSGGVANVLTTMEPIHALA
jgi:hypothetical protein